MTAPEPDGIVWQKSSYCAVNGDCVEVGWRTSSYCGTNGDCVQVAPAPDRVLVRDSKDPEGPALAVPTTAWRTFLRTHTPPEAHLVTSGPPGLAIPAPSLRAIVVDRLECAVGRAAAACQATHHLAIAPSPTTAR